MCCDSWGCKQSETTERLNWTDDPIAIYFVVLSSSLSREDPLAFVGELVWSDICLVWNTSNLTWISRMFME